jgi:hypothetical protein
MRTLQIILVLSAVVLGVPALSSAALSSDFRVHELEREVRELRQVIREQNQRIERLEAALSRIREPAEIGTDDAAPPDSLPMWVDADRWERIRIGMAEMEVIELLGTPTSYRERDGTRRLFYAIDIGTTGFLAGHIDLVERRVVDVQHPRLQ